MTLLELEYIQSELETIHSGGKNNIADHTYTADYTGRKVKYVEQIHRLTGQVLRIYPSCHAAAIFMGMKCQYSISKCCHGKRQTHGAIKWRFYDGPLLDCKYRQYNIIYK